MLPMLFDSDQWWFSQHEFPRVSVQDSRDRYVVKADLPGYKRDQVQLRVIDAHHLLLSGSMTSK